MVLVGIVAFVVVGVCSQIFEPTSESDTADHPNPGMRNIDEKRYMLRLINETRTRAGLEPVSLGDNVAAQLHAESGLENCTGAHWGVDGLKPYMRYSLAGDYQYNAENWAGIGGCVKWYDFYESIGDIESRTREAMNLWMGSEGHRETLLDPHHKKVNIGLAWDRYYLQAVQHFEGDYVEFDSPPRIEDDILVVAGKTKHGFTLEDGSDLAVAVAFDPPPYPLSNGQIARTSCYGLGPPILGIRPPLSEGRRYVHQEAEVVHPSCPDPYEVPPDTPAPSSPEEAEQLHRAMRRVSQTPYEVPVSLALITAQSWIAEDVSFEVRADIGTQLREYGRGVYTVVVALSIADEEVVISEYSIFHNITPPSTYSRYIVASNR